MTTTPTNQPPDPLTVRCAGRAELHASMTLTGYDNPVPMLRRFAWMVYDWNPATRAIVAVCPACALEGRSPMSGQP